MKLKLTYTPGAIEQTCGLFIESQSMNEWMSAAKYFEHPSGVKIYAVPGQAANSLSGALLIGKLVDAEIPQRLVAVHEIGGLLYLTHNTSVSPKLNGKSARGRFQSPHFYHPTFGLIELSEITDWSAYLNMKSREVEIVIPEEGIEIIDTIHNYYIREVEPEKAIEDLIKNSVPNRSKTPPKPLSSFEKVKLSILKRVLKNHKKDAPDVGGQEGMEGGGSAQAIKQKKKKSWWNRKKDDLQEQYDDLEERNKRELDKLMDMIKNDPDLALKYAIPIDRSGATRGTEGAFKMEQRWSGGRSLFRNTSGNGVFVSFKDEQSDLLRTKYQNMAQNYVRDENWEKAAFVHLELLSDPRAAARVLEQGKLYEAAGAIYLTKLKDKHDAARCYENGKVYRKAIDLYEEMDRQEKVGDLYTLMGDGVSAKTAYLKEHKRHVEASNFLDAGRISNDKLNDLPEARALWRKGWDVHKTSGDCLEQFLSSYPVKQQKKEVLKLHKESYEGRRMFVLLDVLFKQVRKDKELQPELEKVVYESVARNAAQDPDITDYIKKINKDPMVKKDVFRFKRFGK